MSSESVVRFAASALDSLSGIVYGTNGGPVEEAMDDEKARRIRKRIAEIARRPANVTFDEINSVFRMLGEFHDTAVRQATHGSLFRVGDQKFMINRHNPGNSQVKRYSVDEFLRAMAELGWYE